jgi:hypothetical protein
MRVLHFSLSANAEFAVADLDCSFISHWVLPDLASCKFCISSGGQFPIKIRKILLDSSSIPSFFVKKMSFFPSIPGLGDHRSGSCLSGRGRDDMDPPEKSAGFDLGKSSKIGISMRADHLKQLIFSLKLKFTRIFHLFELVVIQDF